MPGSARPAPASAREDPLVLRQVRRPLEAARAREPEVGAQRVAHRVDEALGTARVEAVLPPERRSPPRVRRRGRSAARCGRRAGRRRGSAARTSPNGAWPAGRRAPTRSRSRTGEPRRPRSQTSGSNGGRNATDAGGSGGASSSSTSSRSTKRLPLTPSTSTGTSSPSSTSSSRSAVRPGWPGVPRVGLRGADAAEDVAAAADAEQAVRAEARLELVPQLLRQRHVVREQLRREQPLEQVVVRGGCPRVARGRARP